MLTVEEKHQELNAIAKELPPWILSFLSLVLDPKDHRTNAEKFMTLGRKTGSLERATHSASNLLGRPEIRRYVELQKELMVEGVANRLGLTEERMLKEIASLAMANPQDYLDEFGMLKPLDELTREQAAAVRNFQEVRLRNGKIIYRYQLYDKHKSLETLGKTRAVKLFADAEQENLDIQGLLDQLKS